MEVRLRDALRARRLDVAAPTFLVEGGRTLLASDASGRCAFFEPETRTCAVHRRLGHDALPVSCRQFPRVCLLTPRGAFVTLSSYCPTAAALLFSDTGPPGVVTSPPGFPEGAHYEGLDARSGPPPLLRPGVWLGWDGHERWERHVLDVLARDGRPEDALARLAAQAESARSWTVDRGPFLDFLEDVLGGPLRTSAPPGGRVLREEVREAIPPAIRPPATEAGDVTLDGFEAPVRRYLAARAFGSWAAVQGSGLRTAVRALQAALAVLRGEAARLAAAAGGPLDAPLLKEAIRRTDLRLVHLASPEALAIALSRCEAA